MVKNGRVREVTIEDEGAGDVLLADPIDQLLAQDRVIFERLLQAVTLLLLLKAAELQGEMFAVGADVVDEQIVLDDLVTVLAMVPEPASVWNQLAAVVDEGVVDGDDAVSTVAGGRIL